MAPKKKGKGKKGQRKKMAPSGPEPAATPEPAERGQLVGLRSRPDLNGRRVEVKGEAAGKDGAPRFAVRLLFGAGAGTVMKVKAANLELDRDRMLDPAMQTLVAEMQALAPGATPPEERRDWAGGLPIDVLAKIAETHVARTEARFEAYLKGVLGWPEKDIQEMMAKRERNGNCCLFVFAMVCKGWRKAQLKVGGQLRTRVNSDVIMPGQVALAKWALAEGCPRKDGGYTMAKAAAMHGHMELVRWLIQEQGFAMDRIVMGMAARGGNLELVRWLRDKGCDWDARTCSAAAEAGRLGVLRWLRANGCPWDAGTCEEAALGGHLETLRWAHENGCDWNAEATSGAAERGQLEVLQWLRANGCPWDARTCKYAARYGHLETLRWARETGCQWDVATCNVAAQHGHLKTLRWARENGCDWDARTCFHAASGGHLEILQWLRAEGCPWNGGTCFQAVEQGHVKVLRWARENGCEWDAATRDRAAAELGYTDGFGNLLA